MSVSNGHDTTEQQHADCYCAPAKPQLPLFNPLPIVDNSDCKIIQFSAAKKSLHQKKHATIKLGKFNYPMLECS